MTFFGIGLSAYFGPKMIEKRQEAAESKQAALEGSASTEQMYITNMNIIIAEYKEQVAGFKDELKAVREEFAEFKEDNVIKILAYENKIKFLELKIEKKEYALVEAHATILSKDAIILELRDTIELG